jgi:predicted dehydrogenase
LLHCLTGSHLVDQALSLFGPPTSVTGLIGNQRHLPVCSIPDAFTITLQYNRPEGPLSVMLRSSNLCKIPGPRFALHGTQVCVCVCFSDARGATAV